MNNELTKIMIIGTIQGLQASLNAVNPFTFEDLMDKEVNRLTMIRDMMLSLYNEEKELERLNASISRLESVT
mgnify:CR=1 FL=1